MFDTVKITRQRNFNDSKVLKCTLTSHNTYKISQFEYPYDIQIMDFTLGI